MQHISLTFRWNDIKPDTYSAKQLNGGRLDLNLGNGITFVTWMPTATRANFEIISITGDLLDIFFQKEVLQNKEFISKLFLSVRKYAFALLTTKNHSSPSMLQLNLCQN